MAATRKWWEWWNMKLWKDYHRVHWIEAETLHLQNAWGKGRVQRSEEECNKEDNRTPTFQSVFSLEIHKWMRGMWFEAVNMKYLLTLTPTRYLSANDDKRVFQYDKKKCIYSSITFEIFYSASNACSRYMIMKILVNNCIAKWKLGAWNIQELSLSAGSS